MHWHLVSGEYPPDLGGVADHTALIARRLAAAGDTVHVWLPGDRPDVVEPDGVVVHRALGDLGPAALRRAGARIDALPAPRRLLVQWVPHGFGWKSLNLAVPLWLARRARRGDELLVVGHEAGAAFRGRPQDHALALGHRVMAAILLRRAARVLASTRKLEEVWRPLTLGRRVPFEWVPVPSNVPASASPADVAAVRARVAPGGELVVGHFGTYGPLVAGDLEPTIERLLGEHGRRALLVGPGSVEFRARLAARRADLAPRMLAVGPIPLETVAAHLGACDLMVHPYPDGVSTRRGSVMAALALGRPVVTTRGDNTEPLWAESGAVALAPAGDVPALAAAADRLLRDDAARTALAERGRELYAARFDVSHLEAALRAGAR